MLKLIVRLSVISFLFPFAMAGDVEFLHSWSAPKELEALKLLQNEVQKKNDVWVDKTIEEIGGEDGLTSRVFNGRPPSAAQTSGINFKRWARIGFLANLNVIAADDKWRSFLPKAISEVVTMDGKYVAVPVAVHRTNWLWVNLPLLKKLNLDVPRTWAEFDNVALAVNRAGYQVISQGYEDWQYASIFESVTLSVGGSDYYRAAFVEQDLVTLKGETTEKIADRYNKLVRWVDTNQSKDWKQAMADVAEGRAAFTFMGDWAKDEFLNANKRLGQDFGCISMPGTENQFVFTADVFPIFNLPNIQEHVLAQENMVKDMMSIPFQTEMSRAKGAIPVRTDISLRTFDQCAQSSMKAMIAADKSNDLVPSLAYGLAAFDTVQRYFIDKVVDLTKDPLPPKQAAREISKAIRLGNYALR